MRIEARTLIGSGALLLAALLILAALTCGAPKETLASRASRRDAEFADLCTQAGMVTPAYQHPLVLAAVAQVRPAPTAAENPQAEAGLSSR